MQSSVLSGPHPKFKNMGRAKSLLAQQMLSLCDLIKKIVGFNSSVNNVALEISRIISDKLIKTGYIKSRHESDSTSEEDSPGTCCGNHVVRSNSDASEDDDSDGTLCDYHKGLESDFLVESKDDDPCDPYVEAMKTVLKESAFKLHLVLNQPTKTVEGKKLLMEIKTFVKGAKSTLAALSFSRHVAATAKWELTVTVASSPSSSLSSATASSSGPEEERLCTWPEPKNFTRYLKQFYPQVFSDLDGDDDLGDRGDTEDEFENHIRRQLERNPLAREPFTHPGCATPRRHYRDWRKDGFRCICGTIFPSLRHVDVHIKNMGEPPLRLLCQVCKFIGTGQCCLNFHNKDLHSTVRLVKDDRHQCRYGCEKWFRSKNQRNLHEKETDRACKFRNASPLPKKTLPASASRLDKNFGEFFERANRATTAAELTAALEMMMKENKKIMAEMESPIEPELASVEKSEVGLGDLTLMKTDKPPEDN